MTTVGAVDARRHLGALLERTARGETIRITLRGIPIAKLLPDDLGEHANLSDLVQSIRRLRKGAKLVKTRLRELIDKGRR